MLFFSLSYNIWTKRHFNDSQSNETKCVQYNQYTTIENTKSNKQRQNDHNNNNESFWCCRPVPIWIISMTYRLLRSLIFKHIGNLRCSIPKKKHTHTSIVFVHNLPHIHMFAECCNSIRTVVLFFFSVVINNQTILKKQKFTPIHRPQVSCLKFMVFWWLAHTVFPSTQFPVPSTQSVKLNWTNYFIVCIDSIHSLQSIYIMSSAKKEYFMSYTTDDWRPAPIYTIYSTKCSTPRSAHLNVRHYELHTHERKTVSTFAEY